MILTYTFLFLSWLFAPTEIVGGKCSTCTRLHTTSKVYIDSWGACTAMACPPAYYDEKGVYHPSKDCNTCSYGFRCSRGHKGATDTSKLLGWK